MQPMAFDTHAANHHLYKEAPDVFESLEHISLMLSSPGMPVARSTPEEFLKFVQNESDKPGKVIRDSGIEAD